MTPRCFTAICWAGAVAIAGLSCDGDASRGAAIGTWTSACSMDAQCVEGRCICGACTLPCNGSSADCSGGPPGLSCYAAESFAFAELCAGEEAPGLCLIGCGAGDTCEAGLECRSGACVPEGAPLPIAPDASGPEPMPAPVLTSDDCIRPLGGRMSYACACRDASPGDCRTLDEALAETSDCWRVSSGCGMVLLQRNTGFSGFAYWYDSMDGTPVGVEVTSDSGEGTSGADRSLDCDDMRPTCSTCGAGLPNCNDVPGVFPNLR